MSTSISKDFYLADKCDANVRLLPKYRVDDEVLTVNNEVVTIKLIRRDKSLGKIRYLVWKGFNSIFLNEDQLVSVA